MCRCWRSPSSAGRPRSVIFRSPSCRISGNPGPSSRDADIVLLIHRERRKQGGKPEEGAMADHEPPVRRIVVAKNRNGPTGSVKLAWLDRYTPFRNLGGRGRRPRAPRWAIPKPPRNRGSDPVAKGPPSVIPAAACGQEYSRWMGYCPSCSSQAPLVESPVPIGEAVPRGGWRGFAEAAGSEVSAPAFWNEVDTTQTPRRPVGIGELEPGSRRRGSCRDRRSWWRVSPAPGKARCSSSSPRRHLPRAMRRCSMSAAKSPSIN